MSGESAKPASHRPAANLEAQIDAAIEARRQRGAGSATATEEESELEILGTYEYLDHTADVQLHAWGSSLEVALEQLAIAMFGYMTRLSLIQVHEDAVEDSKHMNSIRVDKAHDLQSLVFLFLQEWLTVFHETGFVAREVAVKDLDRETWTVSSAARGEPLDLKRHTQGAEVKAVTYSNLQVVEKEDRCDIWVIVDI
jgi:SHS2 domain-containing protein